jgi:hypothetical protein
VRSTSETDESTDSRYAASVVACSSASAGVTSMAGRTRSMKSAATVEPNRGRATATVSTTR